VGIGFATAVAAYRRSRAAVHLGVFWTLVAVAQLFGVRYSQFTFGFSIAAYAAIVWSVPWLRGTVGWARRGTLGWDVRLLIAAVVATSSVGLIVWHQLTSADLSDISRDFIPDVAPWLLIIGALGFSMVNAMVEEVAYRGVMMHALDAAFGVGVVALVLQAVPFGIMHMTGGFPRGYVGVALATVYGLMMGLIRRRSQGMLAPWLAHVLTDAAIAAIVLGMYAEP
jgi:membrane protease YdiL (CAAX protease family)